MAVMVLHMCFNICNIFMIGTFKFSAIFIKTLLLTLNTNFKSIKLFQSHDPHLFVRVLPSSPLCFLFLPYSFLKFFI